VEAIRGMGRALAARMARFALWIGALSPRVALLLFATPTVIALVALAMGDLEHGVGLAVAGACVVLAVLWYLATVGAVARAGQRRDLLVLAILAHHKNPMRAEFTALVSQMFRCLGYDPKAGRSATDFRMTREDRDIRVRCHAGYGRPASIAILREFADELRRDRAKCAYFVSTESFDPECLDLARERDIALIDGDKLQTLLAKARATAPPSTGWLANALLNATPTATPPQCPRCGAATVLKTPKRKRRFWGCTCWPVCKGRRELTAHDKAVLPGREEGQG